MNGLWLLPSLVAVVIIAAYLGGKVSTRVGEFLNRVGRVLFGRFVTPNRRRELRIESAFIETTYRTYVAKTYLFVVLGVVAGTIAGAYVLAGVLANLNTIVQTLAGLPQAMTAPFGIHPGWEREFASTTWWTVIVGGGAVVGVLTGVLAYVFRWKLPEDRAAIRQRSIDEGLPRTTAFMYALSRGDMEFPQILQTVAEHGGVFGETANEFAVASREMSLFGRDMITAMRRMTERTPSEQFRVFSENLSSVLQSGRNLSSFLDEQHRRFREDAEDRQEEVLEVLETIAEGYVTVLVAGVLFLITILLVFGLTLTDTLWFLQLIIYLIVPLISIGFAVYLQRKLDQLGIARRRGGDILDRMDISTPVPPEPTTAAHRPDGGLTDTREQDNRQMLASYDRVRWLKQTLRSPARRVLARPETLLWVAVPLAVLVFVFRVPTALAGDGVAVRVLDDLIVQSVLLALVPYAIAREIHKRRIDRIEASTPDLLERLASLNEAGMSVVEGFNRMRGSDLGVLTPEVDRIWRDMQHGANIDDALVRFGRRIRTTAITRIVVLLTNATRASGEMGPVLRIAAEQARAEVSLRRKRRQRMLTYLVIIYVSFVVFLVIIAAINEVLVPSLPDHAPIPEADELEQFGPSPDVFTRIGDVDQAAYTLVFFHAALIQAVCAGFIAGQLGEGTLRDGAKHAAIMLTIAYVAVLLLSAPVASVSAFDTTSDGESVFINSASLSEGGFVAIYDGDSLEDDDTQLLGHSEYLPAGTHSDLRVPLQHGEINESKQVLLVVHRDTTGTGTFDFELPYRPGEGQADRPYDTVAEGGTIGVPVNVVYIGE